MATVNSRRFTGRTRDDYLGLIERFPLTAIRSQQAFEAAQDVMDRLLKQGTLSTGEELYLDALSDLVATYEDGHVPISPASDAELLRHLMEAAGETQSELHRETGIAKSTISEILSGKKRFSRQIIATLASHFGIDKSVLAHNL
ncbi:type II toxin-antitoxin system HigA family antitoxin [Rubinisphaera sp. JC750]|uniref:helix-turn-helix domain-containing protein n=1 Tax=Rubinisphaera sp. JC750 TaxID=2898658 RepID=UPI001F436B61|nr:helix-turn-helix domain-containing protein [Rubinisphaera sp. JC750]